MSPPPPSSRFQDEVTGAGGEKGTPDEGQVNAECGSVVQGLGGKGRCDLVTDDRVLDAQVDIGVGRALRGRLPLDMDFTRTRTDDVGEHAASSRHLLVLGKELVDSDSQSGEAGRDEKAVVVVDPTVLEEAPGDGVGLVSVLLERPTHRLFGKLLRPEAREEEFTGHEARNGLAVYMGAEPEAISLKDIPGLGFGKLDVF